MERDTSDIAVFGRILEIRGDRARVDIGGVIVDNVVVSLVDAKVGDYVLIHRGYAIKVVSEEEISENVEEILREAGLSGQPS